MVSIHKPQAHSTESELRAGQRMSIALSQTPQTQRGSHSQAISAKSGERDAVRICMLALLFVCLFIESRSAKQSILPPLNKLPTPLKFISDDENPQINPFVMPPPSEVFAVRERERLKQRQDRTKERTLKVHEKMTYASRRNSKLASLRKHVLTPDLEAGDSALRKDANMQEDTHFLLAATKDRCLEKEDLRNYVGRKKEMFLVQYALGVKREEIHKLEEIARAEEKKLEAAEKYLEQSATMFDDFLKENDKNAVEAIKMYKYNASIVEPLNGDPPVQIVAS